MNSLPALAQRVVDEGMSDNRCVVRLRSVPRTKYHSQSSHEHLKHLQQKQRSSKRHSPCSLTPDQLPSPSVLSAPLLPATASLTATLCALLPAISPLSAAAAAAVYLLLVSVAVCSFLSAASPSATGMNGGEAAKVGGEGSGFSQSDELAAAGVKGELVPAIVRRHKAM